MDTEKSKRGWWGNFKNHLEITKLAGKFGSVSSAIKSDLKIIKDEDRRTMLTTKFEEIQTEEKLFNGDDGSNTNLVKYRDIIARIKSLKQEIDQEKS